VLSPSTILLAGSHRAQHRHSGLPEHVGRNARELDVRSFEKLLQPVPLGRARLHDGASVPHEVAQVSQLGPRNVALSDQPEPQELRDPLRVLNVRLPARHVLHVLRVADDQLEPAGRLQHRVHGLPVDARALHRHVGHAFLAQPLREAEQLARERREHLHLLTSTRALAHQDAGGDLLLVHVEPASSLNDHRIHSHLRREVVAAPQGSS
jgi:hypothetical protein